MGTHHKKLPLGYHHFFNSSHHFFYFFLSLTLSWICWWSIVYRLLQYLHKHHRILVANNSWKSREKSDGSWIYLTQLLSSNKFIGSILTNNHWFGEIHTSLRNLLVKISLGLRNNNFQTTIILFSFFVTNITNINTEEKA